HSCSRLRQGEVRPYGTDQIKRPDDQTDTGHGAEEPDTGSGRRDDLDGSTPCRQPGCDLLRVRGCGPVEGSDVPPIDHIEQATQLRLPLLVGGTCEEGADRSAG